MERDEEGTYALVSRLRREVIEPRLAEERGRAVTLLMCSSGRGDKDLQTLLARLLP